MRVADYVVAKLQEYGVSNYHVVTGRGALFLNDALAKEKTANKTFYHHEQAAAFSAMAQSQLDLKTHVCMASSGCASTNVITPLLCAWQDSIPMMVISGQNVLNETTRYTGLNIKTYGQQEADIIKIVESITKYSVMIEDPKSIRYHIEKAMFLANTGRKGPVWIDIPLDLQNMHVNPEELEPYEEQHEEYVALEEDVNFIVDALLTANRPSVVIGAGVKHANARTELSTFITNSCIPLTYTYTAPDIYGSQNELSIGSVGSQGCSRAGAFTVQNSDLLIVLGSRMNSLTTGPDFCNFAKNAKIIVVDIDEDEHKKKGISIDKFIQADLKSVLTKLNEKSLKLDIEAWQAKAIHWKALFSQSQFLPIKSSEDRLDIYEIAQVLSDKLPEECTFICDSGFIDVIMPTTISFGNKQRCLHSSSQGAMGYALPAAIGTAKVSDSPTLVFVGDGSIMMNLQELETIRSNELPIKIFVLNNDVYGVIRRRQHDLFRRRTIGVDNSNGVSCPDFEQVANTFGFEYRKVTSLPQFQNEFREVVNMAGPVICEIMTNLTQDYLEIGYGRDENKKFVRKPIEDQKPFLEREIFEKEMVVEKQD